METLSIVVALLVALSVASERLVEIVKNLIPFLSVENSDAAKERLRYLTLDVLAVIAGITTAILARPALENIAPPGCGIPCQEFWRLDYSPVEAQGFGIQY